MFPWTPDVFGASQLFDLMTMGFKYQMLACSFPQELLHVTLNHLYQLRAKVEDAGPVVALVDEVIALTNDKYATMSPLDFAGLKQTLCRFFADKRVKVSLFLQDGLQKNDGTLTLGYSGPLPPGNEIPGRIHYYDVSGAGLGSDSFDFPHVESISNASLGPPIDPARLAACSLGHNLYTKEAAAKPPPAAQAAAAEAAAAAAAAASHGGAVQAQRLDSAAAERAILAGDSHARQDLNLLADLMGRGAENVSSEPFKLNLFPDTSMPGSVPGKGRGVVPTTDMVVIDVGVREMSAANRDLVGVMDHMSLGGGGDDWGAAERAPEEDDDDLLGLMDEAAR